MLLKLYGCLALVKCKRTAILTFMFLVATTAPAEAFEIAGNKWLGAKAEFYVSIPGLSATQISWNTAVIESLKQWSQQTVFDFTVVEENKDPCAADGFSSIDFADDLCGSEFGERTLAVAIQRYESQALGPPNIIEGDIVVNAAEQFDIFDGPLIQFGQINNGLEFRRVALHELGHVIGLDHEEVAPAIMAPEISNIFTLQKDDINGVAALYSGLDNCEIKQLRFGRSDASLDAADCTVQEMTVGGSDTSYIDLYKLEVEQPAQFEFSTTSESLDTVLLIATEDLEYLEVETESIDDCNSSISTSLSVGSYLLMVNTFALPIKAACGGTGPYTLTANFSSAAKSGLGQAVSLLGSYSMARFSGSVSADGGETHGNLFTSEDSLTISADITVDMTHVGKPGFLLVAALLPDQLLMLNEQGEFVDTGLNPDPFVVHARKTLEPEEALDIARDLIPSELGIEAIEVDFLVGYGLDSNPLEVYFHNLPLNLTVQPAVINGS